MSVRDGVLLVERWCRWKNPAPLFNEVPPVVLPPLPAVEPAARKPVQSEFDPRRVYIRHTDLEMWGYTQLLVVTKVSDPWDVGDQRLATAEERITEFIAEQVADSDSRTHTAVS